MSANPRTLDPSTRHRQLPRALLAVYALNACVHVAGLFLGRALVEMITKPLITVLLMALVLCRWASADRRLVQLAIAALCLSLGGDVLLQADPARFLLSGIGLFACAHIAYGYAFLTLPAPRRPVVVTLGVTHLAVWIGVNVYLWPRLGVSLGLTVLAYSALLLGMAALSWRAGWSVGVGGILFVASDAALALRDFAGIETAGIGIFVIVSYIVAQGLIVDGLSRRR